MLSLPQSIMIVEDDISAQESLKNLLTLFGVSKINCFSNANDVLNELCSFSTHYDIILMDIALHGSMDGIELSKKILKIKKVPIVFMTGYNEEETFSELLKVAPYGFIEKPLSAEVLKQTLSIAYQRYQSEVSFLNPPSNLNQIVIDDYYSYSKEKKSLYYNGKKVKLNLKEQILVDLLVEDMNEVISYDKLIYHIWNEAPSADSTLRTLIYSLRKKLVNFPIVSYSKLGYSLTKAN